MQGVASLCRDLVRVASLFRLWRVHLAKYTEAGFPPRPKFRTNRSHCPSCEEHLGQNVSITGQNVERQRILKQRSICDGRPARYSFIATTPPTCKTDPAARSKRDTEPAYTPAMPWHKEHANSASARRTKVALERRVSLAAATSPSSDRRRNASSSRREVHRPQNY